MKDIPKKVAKRLDLGYDVGIYDTEVYTTVSVPNGVSADNGNELEADLKKVRDTANEVTRKWSNK